MRYSVLFDRLQNLIGYRPSQKELGNVLGLAQTAVSGRAMRNSNFPDEEVAILEKYYNVNLLSDNVKCGIIEIPYWEYLPEDLKISDFTCVTAERNVIKKHWYIEPDALRIVSMVGDKMSNYWYKINDGDILIIDTSHNYIMGNGVYFATSQNNSRFWIREMQILINNDIQIKGYAPSGDTVKVFSKQELDAVDFRLIGKVIKNVSFRL